MAGAIVVLLALDTCATGWLLAKVVQLCKVVALTGEHCQSVGGLACELEQRIKALEG